MERISFCCSIFTALELLKENRMIILMLNLMMSCHHFRRHHRDRHGQKIELRNHLNNHGSLNNLLTNDGWMFRPVGII